MSSAIQFDTSDDWQRLVMKWTAAGHEVIHERGTFRHKAYRKNLDPNTPVKIDGVQFITSHGHALTYGDILPERADLALDIDCNVLPQHEFENRYLEYLNWFDFGEGSDPKAEYIPHVTKYISQTPDVFSESPGMVEIGFDARKPAPDVERTHLYNPVTDEMVEVQKKQGEALETTLAAVKQLLESPPKRGPGRPRKDEQVD